jgi:hypothetical protein
MGLALLSALAVSAAPSMAGPPSASDRATARALMTEGYAALKNGDAARALERFRAADALVHVPTTALAVAQAQVQLGQLVEAEQSATGVINIPPHDDDPTVFRKAREDAASLLRDVDPRVPSLRIQLRGMPRDVTPHVTVDDEPVPAAALAAARRMDPGSHAVVVTIGDWVHRVDVILKEREAQEVVFDVPEGVHGAASESASTAPPASAAPSSEPSTSPIATVAPALSESASPQPAAPSSAGRWVMWGGFGVGVVGVAVGASAGILALVDKNNAFGKGCVGNVCPTTAHNDLQSARTAADVSTAGFIVGGVGVAVGVVALLLSGPSVAPAPTAGLRVVPTLGPGAIGMRGEF